MNRQATRIPIRKCSGERGFIKYAIFLLIVFGGVFGGSLVAFARIHHGHPWTPAFYEKDPPTITWVNEPVGIGSDVTVGKVLVSDSGGGLDEVVVRLSQRNQPIELVKQDFSEDTPASREIEIPLDAKALNLREGKAELEVLAFDRTLWSNAAHLVLPLSVDFARPRIEVITPQQNAVEGGVELVFFKVIGKKPVAQGVEARGTLYPAFEAKQWDASFKSYEDLYFAFFPIPIGMSDEGPRMKVTGRDDIGNSASAPFNYLIRHRKFPTPRTDIDDQSATRLVTSFSAFAKDASLFLSLKGNVANDLPALIRALRLQDEGILSEVFSKPDGTRRWKGPFVRPVTTLPSNSMGELRSYFVAGTEIWKDVLGGVRFGNVSHANVSAVNAGRIALVGDLGLLGKTVVIDHGFGLSTLYAHLSETSCTTGDQVTSGQVIGKTGSTGFALGDELYFEVRMHGVPVSPNEWWDSTWVADHIDKKIAFVQGALIGNPGE